MTHHVVFAVDGESYTPSVPAGETTITIETLGSDVRQVLARMPKPIPPLVLDLLEVSVAAYVADRVVERRKAGWDGWQRDLVLHVPVRDESAWAGKAGEALRSLIAYLTGDVWRLEVRARSAERPYVPRKPRPPFPEVGQVALFSGGLDSFVGAIDLLTHRTPVLFVGHRGRNPASGVGSSQRAALAHLRTMHPAAELVQFFVAEPLKVGTEDSTRSRALLFYALATATAFGTGARGLVIPENGYLSLNVPLSLGHVGSFSTRSTHPHTMVLLRALLTALGLELEVTLPYHHKTKGEVLQDCLNQSLLQSGLVSTISCGHPSVAGRDPKLPAAQRRSGQHCGYCLACLVRRAAIEHAFGTDVTFYAYGQPGAFPVSRTATLQAVRQSLRTQNARTDLQRIAASGPLDVPPTEVLAFRDVYRRGQNELRTFLAHYGL